MTPQPGLLVVLGPTGSGKSTLSIALAKQFNGEVVNCDSVQLYRGLDIGSAKIPPDQRMGVPHHLIDVAGVQEDITAGAYARLARAVLADLQRRQKLPVVVGGTGFYLRALLDGLSPAPQRDDQLRSRLTKIAGRRPRFLHRFLQKHDAEAAARIHPNDHQKLIRAIELTLLAGQPATATQERPRDRLHGFRTLKIGLCPDRKLLSQQINIRAARMFESGLVEETQMLLANGASTDAKALQSLGYRQALQLMAGHLTREEAVRECQTKTRQYAKRQMTWFRRETGVHWLPGFGNQPEIVGAAVQLAETFLFSG